MTDNQKWAVLKVLPSDYNDYGGRIERWRYIDLNYPDCSNGCKWWDPLHNMKDNQAACKWGVCTNPKSPRAGLLTWEHQAGFMCFESKQDE